MRWTSLLLAAVLAGAIGPSCRHPKDDKAGDPSATGAAEPSPAEVVIETVLGRIIVIGADNAFVVFQLEAGESVSPGEELEVRFAGTTVGKIKVTPERKNRMVAADVLSGTVEKGYEVVHLKTEKTTPPTP